MANTDRRTIDRSGRMFIPMNMQGSSGKEYFITVPKLCILCGILFYLYLYISYGSNLPFTLVGWIITGLVSFLALQWVIRKFILDEDYFYEIYSITQNDSSSNDSIEQRVATTPDTFWDISSIRHTSDGDILIYSDMKLACILKLERDTIVGKAEESSEKHFDAWSDFYREIHHKNLNIIQMNLMEPSGKDPRLNTLGATITRVENSSIKYALELELGHLKRISNAMLSEFEYIMIYTRQVSRMDSLTDDIIECSYTLLNGAYSTAKIMTEREINELPKSMFNVSFFDGVQAQINVYLNENRRIPDIMKIYRLKMEDGNFIDLNDKDRAVIEKLSGLVSNNVVHNGEWTVQDALDGKIDKLNNFNGVRNINTHTTSDSNKKADKNKKDNKKNKKEKKSIFSKKNKNDNNSDINNTNTDELTDEELFG